MTYILGFAVWCFQRDSGCIINGVLETGDWLLLFRKGVACHGYGNVVLSSGIQCKI